MMVGSEIMNDSDSEEFTEISQNTFILVVAVAVV
jgi:hypothetical protein